MRALSKSDLALEISFCAHLEKINEKILFGFFFPQKMLFSQIAVLKSLAAVLSGDRLSGLIDPRVFCNKAPRARVHKISSLLLVLEKRYS